LKRRTSLCSFLHWNTLTESAVSSKTVEGKAAISRD
jgi:hypothetical protein